MLPTTLILLSLMAAASAAQPATDDVQITEGAGRFVVSGGPGREQKVVTVEYYKPATFTARSPVLIVLPGAGRNAWTYRDAWVQASEAHGVLILSPSYSEDYYPDFWSYNLAGMIDDVRVNRDQTPAITFRAVTDSRAWIFGDFDRLFDLVKQHLKLEANTYDMFGHSAGGQLLQRLVLFHPGSKAHRIVAANSGWYTVPTFDDVFPYGLKGSAVSPEKMAEPFAAKLIVLLGERDDENETRGDLVRTPEVDVQGISRVARGRHFYRHAQQTARQLGMTLQWTLETVPNVGHDLREMSAAAARLLY